MFHHTSLNNSVFLPWESKALTFLTVSYILCSSSSFPLSSPVMSSCNVGQPLSLFSLSTTCAAPWPVSVFTESFFPYLSLKTMVLGVAPPEQLTQGDCLSLCSILAFCSLTSSNYHNLELAC